MQQNLALPERSIPTTILVLILMVATTVGLSAQPAHACSVSIDSVDLADLATDEPQAAFATAWAEFDADERDAADAPVLIGAFREETVDGLAANDIWNRGGVVSRTRAWGEAGAAPGTHVRHAKADDCGTLSGRSVGHVEHYVITDDQAYRIFGVEDETGEAALSALFGDPTDVDRDPAAEAAALAQIKAERATSIPPMLVAILAGMTAIAVVAIIGRYLVSRRSRPQPAPADGITARR